MWSCCFKSFGIYKQAQGVIWKLPFLFFSSSSRQNAVDSDVATVPCHLLLPSAREDKDPRVVPISHSSSSFVSLPSPSLSLPKSSSEPNPSFHCRRCPLHIAGEPDVLKTGDLVHPLGLVVLFTPVSLVHARSFYSRGAPSTSRAAAAVLEHDSVATVAPPVPKPCPMLSRWAPLSIASFIPVDCVLFHGFIAGCRAPPPCLGCGAGSGDQKGAATPPLGSPRPCAPIAPVPLGRGGPNQPGRGRHGRRPWVLTSADVICSYIFRNY